MIIGILGIGYVGLPLALALGKKFETIGYDVSKNKILNYKNKVDITGENKKSDFQSSKYLTFTSEYSDLKVVDYFIVAVPTPVDKANIPDLSALKLATETVAKVMRKKSIIIFEPTVFPGATEEICIPILEKYSKLKWLQDFNIAYSPERINPGDKKNSLTNIIKVVSADNPKTLKKVSNLYKSIIKAGIYEAPSIKVAEAAKVIENTQRDLNIALMNEFAMAFKTLNIDTGEILKTASSKWNFLNFKPGLVGGHCIGVDPYYLTHKAQSEGYHPQLILAGRKINDGMPEFISKEVVKKIIKLKKNVSETKILILGLTFKENCSDLRNSKVIDLVNEFKQFGCEITVNDPIAEKNEARNYGIFITDWDKIKPHDVVIAAVSHSFYLNMPLNDIFKKIIKNGLFVDLKSEFSKSKIIQSGFNLWRL